MYTGAWGSGIQHIFGGDTVQPKTITKTQRFEYKSFIWGMILGSIGRGVGEKDREEKEAKIMCLMEWSLLWATEVSPTGSIWDIVWKILQSSSLSSFPPPCPRGQGDGEFILQFPSITG